MATFIDSCSEDSGVMSTMHNVEWDGSMSAVPWAEQGQEAQRSYALSYSLS